MKLQDHVDRPQFPEPGNIVTYRGPRGDTQGRLVSWDGWGAKIEGHGWSAECLPVWAIRPATQLEVSEFLDREWRTMNSNFEALEEYHATML